MKRRDKIFIAVVALIIIGLIILVSRKPEELNDSDLYVARRDIPEDQSAYTYIKQAMDCMVHATNSAIYYKYYDRTNGVDELEIKKLIEDNKKALELIEKAVTCDDCLFPECDVKNPTKDLGARRELARIINIKAEYEARSGAYSNSLGSCLLLIKYGQLLIRHPESLIEYMSGTAVMNMGLDRAIDIAMSKEYGEVELVRLKSGMPLINEMRCGVIQAFKKEYVIMKKMYESTDPKAYKSMVEFYARDIKCIERLWLTLPMYFFNSDETIILMFRKLRRVIDNVPRFYSDMKIKISDTSPSALKLIMSAFRPNAVGRIIVDDLKSYDSNLRRKCSMECRIDAVLIIAACRLYEMKHGKLPDKLETLVPEYLESVPLDPFDGKPFRYKPEKDIIYSVNKDLIDSGGSTNSPPDTNARLLWEREDAVFEIHKK